MRTLLLRSLFASPVTIAAPTPGQPTLEELGFTLAEITELLALRLDPRTTAADVKARAGRKIEDVDRRIRDLERIRAALTHLAGSCRGGRGPAGECPLVEALGPLEGA